MESICKIMPIASDPAASADLVKETVEKSRMMQKPCIIQMEKGLYAFDEPLQLDERDSGLTLCGEEGVVFTAAHAPAKLQWAPWRNGIWKAEMKDKKPFSRLFADGAEQTLCRYPNKQAGAVPLEGAATPAEIKARAMRYTDPENGIVRAIHPAGWGGNSYVVTGKDPSSPCGLALSWFGDNNRGDTYGNAMVVENVLEELDAPGEWYFDRKAQTLYWYPDQGQDPNEVQITVSRNRTLLQIQGASPAVPAADIRLKQITFCETGLCLFSYAENRAVYHPLLRGDWAIAFEGAVRFENTRSCCVSNCKFCEIGGNALFLYGYNAQTAVSGNTFTNIAATSIQVIGNQKAVRQPSYWEHALYPAHCVHATKVDAPNEIGPCAEDYPRELEISENHINGVGRIEKQSAGINLSVAARIHIHRNTIRNSPRSLINVNDGTFGGHDIAYNDLFDSQRETEDHGPFNAWGRDRFWSVPRYNASGLYGKTIRRYKKGGVQYDISKIDACFTTRIHHNRFHHSADAPHSWGIDLDDGSTNYEIDHNLVLGIGIKLREGFDRNVHHNLLVGGQLQIHVPYTECRDRVAHNLILHDEPVGFVCSKKRLKAARSEFKNNYFIREPASLRAMLPPQIVLTDYAPAGEDDYNPKNAPDGWEPLPCTGYGAPNCPCEAPRYVWEPSVEAQQQKRRVLGALCSNVTEALRSATASPDCAGLYILKIFPLSRAWRWKLRAGDILLTVNGKAAEQYERGKVKSLTYRREGKIYTVGE